MTTPGPIRPLLAALLLALATVASAQEPSQTLDLAACEPGTVGLFWGLGSVHFEIAGPEDDGCRFAYFWEMEGGYELSDCLAPRSLGGFALDPAAYRPPFDEEAWEVHEAVAPHCTLVRTGNLLLEMESEPPTDEK